jgi:hypothetical protein
MSASLASFRKADGLSLTDVLASLELVVLLAREDAESVGTEVITLKAVKSERALYDRKETAYLGL